MSIAQSVYNGAFIVSFKMLMSSIVIDPGLTDPSAQVEKQVRGLFAL